MASWRLTKLHPGSGVGRPRSRFWFVASVFALVGALFVGIGSSPAGAVPITVDGDQIDLTLKGPEGNAERTQGIDALPIVTAEGHILPAGSLARIEVTAGPTEIRHVERQRTVTLKVSPAPSLPLEVALDILQNEVVAPLEALTYRIRLESGIES